jgi:hypothetical protein
MNANGPALGIPWVFLGVLVALGGLVFLPMMLLGPRRGRTSADMGGRISRGLLTVGGILGGLVVGLLLMVLTVRTSYSPARVDFQVSGVVPIQAPYSGRIPLAPRENPLPHVMEMGEATAYVATQPAMSESSEAPEWARWRPERLATYWRTEVDGTGEAPVWAGGGSVPYPADCAIAMSQWFATREEAERQGTQRLVVAMYPKLAETDRWVVLSPQTLVPHLARSPLAKPEGVLEVARKDFGNGLTANMYRAHFRLEHCGRVAAEMPRFWLAEAQRERGLLLGGCLCGLTAVFAGAGWGLRRLGV